MNYLLKSKPKSNNTSKVIAILGPYLVLSLVGFFFGNLFREAVWITAEPFWKVSAIVASPFGSITNYFHTKNGLVHENLTLEEELSGLRTKALAYDALLLENDDLRTELGRTGRAGKIFSAILSKPPRSPYDTLVIDIGSSNGVIQGSKVFLGDTVVVGFVTSVTQYTSLVTLFSSSGEKQEAIVERTGASFVLTGKGGGNFELSVPVDTDVVWGDTFTYPGLSQNIIATVYYVDTNSQSSFKTIHLRVPTNVFASKYVFVQKAE